MLKRTMGLLLAVCMLLTVGCTLQKAASAINEFVEAEAQATSEPVESALREIDKIGDDYFAKLSECRELLRSAADAYLAGGKPDSDALQKIETLDDEIKALFRELKNDAEYGVDSIKKLQEDYESFYDAVLKSDHSADSYEVTVTFAELMVLGDLSDYARVLTDILLRRG